MDEKINNLYNAKEYFEKKSINSQNKEEKEEKYYFIFNNCNFYFLPSKEMDSD